MPVMQSTATKVGFALDFLGACLDPFTVSFLSGLGAAFLTIVLAGFSAFFGADAALAGRGLGAAFSFMVTVSLCTGLGDLAVPLTTFAMSSAKSDRLRSEGFGLALGAGAGGGSGALDLAAAFGGGGAAFTAGLGVGVAFLGGGAGAGDSLRLLAAGAAVSFEVGLDSRLPFTMGAAGVVFFAGGGFALEGVAFFRGAASVAFVAGLAFTFLGGID
mmetsp:Transcript_25491/g.82353  ORF Transcript_25491/g.82353 Transcript_25491/m.82353 type:complete len:216 (+) Transcript_25491:3754-4401(+)